ncbi:hypothetical protein B0H11DRAFT_223302 [Mycena galericulata]|nr:hypothetical protein B0H11DRAFT_223302 [Mycena galericulata]
MRKSSGARGVRRTRRVHRVHPGGAHDLRAVPAAPGHVYGRNWRWASNMYSMANAGKYLPNALKSWHQSSTARFRGDKGMWSSAQVWQLLTHTIYSTAHARNSSAVPHIAEQTPRARQVGGGGGPLFVRVRAQPHCRRPALTRGARSNSTSSTSTARRVQREQGKARKDGAKSHGHGRAVRIA